MEVLDGQGLVRVPPGTDRFTGMVADPAAGAGKGVVGFEQGQGLGKICPGSSRR